MTRLSGILAVFCGIMVLAACKEKFEADLKLPNAGFLVVEGYINIGEKAVTKVSLSRTTPIQENTQRVVEADASVNIESSDGELFPLHQTIPGEYVSDSITLTPERSYRLAIDVNNKNYYSDFAPAVITPEIDSVTWSALSDGVQISVYTHDNSNQLRHYAWNYDEVWETKSPRISFYDYVHPDWVNRTAEEIKLMQTCWKYQSFRGFNMMSTEGQAVNAVVDRPITKILNFNERLSVRYSINVTQHVVSKAEYQYIDLILRNSEKLGSLYDPLPGELTGNLYCETTTEPVIGFIGAYSTSSKRIFIEHSDLAVWDYSVYCEDSLAMFSSADLKSLMKYYRAVSFHYTEPLIRDGVTVVPDYCVDCRIGGGTALKPEFWQ